LVVAVTPPTVPADAGALASAMSACSVSDPESVELSRADRPLGAVHVTVAAAREDQSETTKSPAPAVVVGVVCEVPLASPEWANPATGLEASTPE
jgi:hypothetical protein